MYWKNVKDRLKSMEINDIVSTNSLLLFMAFYVLFKNTILINHTLPNRDIAFFSVIYDQIKLTTQICVIFVFSFSIFFRLMACRRWLVCSNFKVLDFKWLLAPWFIYIFGRFTLSLGVETIILLCFETLVPFTKEKVLIVKMARQLHVLS